MKREQFRCSVCGYETPYLARIQRHMDGEHYPGGRIECVGWTVKR